MKTSAYLPQRPLASEEVYALHNVVISEGRNHVGLHGEPYTNTFAGVYRASTSVAAVTNERPKILGPLAAPASAVLTVDSLAVSPNLGLVALSDSASGTLQITYRETNP